MRLICARDTCGDGSRLAVLGFAAPGAMCAILGTGFAAVAGRVAMGVGVFVAGAGVGTPSLASSSSIRFCNLILSVVGGIAAVFNFCSSFLTSDMSLPALKNLNFMVGF